MKKATILIMTAFLCLGSLANAQEVKKDSTSADDKFSLNVTLNSDIFFGFYPFFSGSYALGEKSAFTFYGILWSGGTGAGWGNWTEFGVGYKFMPVSCLSINPQIGLLNGSLTSGLGTPVLGEGLVPNLTVGLNCEKLEGELYGGYYIGLDHGNPVTNNYLHYWANGGYKFSKAFSAGVHYEHLRFMGGQNHAADAAYDYYMSVGPYVQFSSLKGNSFARFSTGGDLRSESEVAKSGWKQPSFYKLTLGYSF